jgi:hypothetical protein
MKLITKTKKVPVAIELTLKELLENILSDGDPIEIEVKVSGYSGIFNLLREDINNAAKDSYDEPTDWVEIPDELLKGKVVLHAGNSDETFMPEED